MRQLVIGTFSREFTQPLQGVKLSLRWSLEVFVLWAVLRRFVRGVMMRDVIKMSRAGGVKNSRGRTKKLHGGGAIQEVTVHFFEGPDRLQIPFVVVDWYNFGCQVLEDYNISYFV